MSAKDRISKSPGMTSVEVCLSIAEMNPDIAAMGFAAYTPQPSMSREIAMNAARGKATPLERRLRRNRFLSEDIIWLKRRNITLERIVDMIDVLSPGDSLALVSTVKLSGVRAEQHIPMMDFDYPATEENLREITDFMQRFAGIQGYVLNSGGGFHFYGIEPVTYGNLTVFLGKCLMNSPCTLGRYIGHQLWDHCMALRISPKSNGSFPMVVAQV